MKTIKWGFVVVCFFFSLNSVSSADKSVYLYDDAGRLSRVSKGTEGLSYQCDQVRNLVSVSKNAISANFCCRAAFPREYKTSFHKKAGELSPE